MLFGVTVPFMAMALKIDNTHYRFCVMDDGNIIDYAAKNAEASNQLPVIAGASWNGYHGVQVQGYEGNLKSNYTTDVDILVTSIYNGSEAGVVHRWGKGYNGVVYDQTTYFYIEVDAPSGVKLSDIPSKMLVGETVIAKKSLIGSYTSFSGSGYFSYSYESSDESVASFSLGKVIAKGVGKATLTVKAYAKNFKYSGSYYIGSHNVDVDVVESLDPTDIILTPKELILNVGEDSQILATLMPEDARADIIWRSSDESVATVVGGLVKATGRGGAIIKATTSNGLSAECYVTVLGDEDYKNVNIGNLFYDLDREGLTATVVPKYDENGERVDNYVSGEILIPDKVSYNGKDYQVTKIDDYAFKFCDLTAVTLPEHIIEIGAWAFEATSITDIALPDALTTIGCGAFGMSKIESLIIGPNVSYIGGNPCAGCENLRAIYIDNGNTNYVMFNDCLYLSSLHRIIHIPLDKSVIEFSDGIEIIEPFASYHNTMIQKLIIPEGVSQIGSCAFKNCENLSILRLPESLFNINNGAFESCYGLTEIYIGSKIKIIEKGVFKDAHKLAKVKIDALNPPEIAEDDDVFTHYDASLIVPKGRISVYKKHPVWGKFAQIVDDENDAGVDGLTIDAIDKYAIMNLYNLSGLCLRRNVSQKDLESLAPGIYIARASNGEAHKIVIH